MAAVLNSQAGVFSQALSIRNSRGRSLPRSLVLAKPLSISSPSPSTLRPRLHVRAEVSSADVEEASSPPPSGKSEGLKRTAELEEKFAVLDSGKWGCNSCGYVYDQVAGDPTYPIPAGLEFKKLPEDWICPTCGGPQSNFSSKGREVAGFAQNQAYGLGTNAMTSSQKGLLIWGSLAVFFALFMGGYFLE